MAAEFMIRAAEMGSEDAMCELEKMSLTGEGMVRNDNNACKWLSKAAARGSEEAKMILEEMMS